MEIADQIRQWLLAVAAIGGGFFAWGAFKRERRRDELRDTERRQEQAKEVAAWLAMKVRDKDYGDQSALLISNQSSTPVYDVRASVVHRSNQVPPVALHLVQALPKRETPIWLSEEEDRQLLVLEDPVWVNERLRIPERRRPVGDFLVALQFRDAGGQWWQRDTLGKLVPIDEPTPQESEGWLLN